MRTLALFGVFIAGMAATAEAQVTEPIVSVRTEWAAQPDEATIQAAKPAGVASRAYAAFSCDVGEDRDLINCRGFYEAPQNVGLRAAALTLVPDFRVSPEMAAIAHSSHSPVTLTIGWAGEGGPCLPPNCVSVPPPPAPKTR